MSKLISWIVLGLFVVAVPFGSWYYLKKGLDFRRHALSELLVKDSISVKEDSLKLMIGKTSVLVLRNSPEIGEHLQAIYTQFKKTDGFQIICFDSIGTFPVLPVGYLSGLKAKFGQNDFVLIDTGNKIRHVYNNNIEDIKKMIEHIAITIPRPKEADIKMKQ
ncbi:MAG: hypothetical protein IPO92_05180 [Saprospiraceae bacterium]|nr:hypothetical protein [Saprospiraceae bacterium]